MNNNNNNNIGRYNTAGKGHEYEKLGNDIKPIVEKLESDYGHSLGETKEILKMMYPNGVNQEQLGDVVSIVRMLDEMFKVARIDGAVSDENRDEVWKEMIAKAFATVAQEQFQS